MYGATKAHSSSLTSVGEGAREDFIFQLTTFSTLHD